MKEYITLVLSDAATIVGTEGRFILPVICQGSFNGVFLYVLGPF